MKKGVDLRPKLLIVLGGIFLILSLYFIFNYDFKITGYTPYDVSTASYNNVNISTISTVSKDLFFKPDGTKLYEVDAGTREIYEYDFFNETNNFSKTFSSDGNYNWTIQVYGGDNYLYESIRYFTLDTTPPTITFSCDKGSVSTGNLITCTCSAVDSLTGVQSTTYTTNPSTAATGSFSTSCTSKDNLNNSDTKNFAYTVTSSTTSTSSGGGSSKGSPTETKTSLLVNVNPGELTKISTFQGTGVKEISIIINKQLQNIRIQVYKYDLKPIEVSKEISGKRYRYLRIETGNLNDDLDSANVEFEVENSWLEDNSLQTDEISIFKFDNQTETWNELETTYNGEENGIHIYSVKINSFSFFAVAEKSKPSFVEEIVDAVAESYDIAKQRKYGGFIWWMIFGTLFLASLFVANRIRKQIKNIGTDRKNYELTKKSSI